MKLPPERPFALVLAFALIRVFTKIVPAADQGEFEYNWRRKLIDRWEMLVQMSMWNPSEQARLIVWLFTASLPEAIQHFGSQETVRAKVAAFIQSPITCLSTLLLLFISITIFSGGLPATRDVFFKQLDFDNSKLVYVWAHNLRGGGDRPLPAEAIKDWKADSKLITAAAAFRAVQRPVQINNSAVEKRLVVITEPSFFKVMGMNRVPDESDGQSYIVLSDAAWTEFFHASPRVIGSSITVAANSYIIRGILPAGFEPLSRRPAIYLIEPHLAEHDAYAAIKARPGITKRQLNDEFGTIAQTESNEYLWGQIRFGFAQSSIWEPVRSFAWGALASAAMLLMVFRSKWKGIQPQKSQAFVKRTAFFLAKIVLGLICVFTACLEWSRSESSILFGNFDPASGPFLLWLYILGSMGVFFWAAVDQKARCRQCLQLLAFPVRMGSPGSMLLDWSGIELCCTEGHGVLHVPHLMPSWAEESDHWIALDDSWQGIFGPDKQN